MQFIVGQLYLNEAVEDNHSRLAMAYIYELD